MPDSVNPPHEAPRRLGPLVLATGITPVNGLTFLFANMAFVMLTSFVSFVQPYLLTETLQVPAERQGQLTGQLSLLQEVICIVLYGLIGALSDRTGRRILSIVGFLLMAVGIALFPLATVESDLYWYRAVIAVGTALAVSANVAALTDVAAESTRARWGAANSICTGLGIALLSLVGVRLPEIYSAAGADPVEAGRYAFWTAAVMGIIAAGIVSVGFYRGVPAGAVRDQSMVQGMIAALREGWRNPSLLVSFGSGFAARGDMVVVGFFLSLWFVRAGADQGMSAAAALGRFGIALFAFQGAIFVWAPIFGWIMDRISRVLSLGIAMALAAAGYFLVGNVTDPFDSTVMVPAMLVLGVGEISVIIAAAAVLGQESPARMRGAAAGVFSVFATVGILFATMAGGIVFDRIGYSAPFAMMAYVNGAVAVWAFLVYARVRKPVPA